MMDECKPFQLDGGGCIWLSTNGAVGEIEFIYPKEIQKNDSFLIGKSISGIPLFEVTSSVYKNCCIQILDDGFLIWLKESTEVELLITHGQMGYLMSNNQLCGIIAKDPTIFN